MATANFIGLFADHRAVSAYAMAPAHTDCRVWAGEKLARTTGLVWGSVLWLLNRFDVVVASESKFRIGKNYALSRGDYGCDIGTP